MNISHQSELHKHFQDLLDADPDFRWALKEHAGKVGDQLRLDLDGNTLCFAPVLVLCPGEGLLRELSERKGNPVLLVVAEINERLLGKCKEAGLCVLDLNGRAWIRTEGVWIDRPSLPGRKFRYTLAPRNIFVGKSERVVRTLLTNRDREWTQAELVHRTGASSGLVSRIVNHLVYQGYLSKTGSRVYSLSNPLELLDSWAKADRLNNRAVLRRYTGLSPDPAEWAKRLQFWAEQESVDLAFTQWTAAWERFGYSEPVVCSAYARRFPTRKELESLGLREVQEAGQVWLYLPEDEGVFLETARPLRLPVVSDAQIYIDLQNTGLRGPDAAQALRDWEGFCRA